MKRKGIILAGGAGTRLMPSTSIISKQLLPVYDKPMIYYSLSILMMIGIQEILIVCADDQIDNFENLLGCGGQLGISISYKVQDSPRGISDGLIIGEEFLDGHPCALILGDNIFYGDGLSSFLTEAARDSKGATIFACFVKDPERYGVVDFNKDLTINNIEEKPKSPKSHYAITGLYFFDGDASLKAKKIKPSGRGELEITDLQKMYLAENKLELKIFGRGVVWFDTGTQSSLMRAAQFVESIESRQGLKIACLEEIAFKKKWITKSHLQIACQKMKNSQYGEYLRELCN